MRCYGESGRENEGAMGRCKVLLKLSSGVKEIRATVTDGNRWKILDPEILAELSDLPASQWEAILADIAEDHRDEVGYSPTAPWGPAIVRGLPGSEILESSPYETDPGVDC